MPLAPRGLFLAALAALTASCVQSVDKGSPLAVMVSTRPTPMDAAQTDQPAPRDASEAEAAPTDISPTDAPAPMAPNPPPDAARSPPPTGEGTPAQKPCLVAGAPCSEGATCCGRGAFCFKGGLETVCVADCANSSDCANGCCTTTPSGKKVCGPKNLCAGDAPAPPDAGRDTAAAVPCGRLIVRGQDGRFLGVATASPATTDGVCNQASPFATSAGTNSIFNRLGPYGNPTSLKSAYHPSTLTPPAVHCETSGRRRWWVSKNKLLTGPGIDPDALCTTLAGNFL